MNFPNVGSAALNSDDELFDIVRIRLWNRQDTIAILSELFMAERVLERWGGQADASPVRFEITFIKGQVIRGSHVFFHKGKRKTLLSTYVRKLLGSKGERSPHVHGLPLGPVPGHVKSPVTSS